MQTTGAYGISERAAARSNLAPLLEEVTVRGFGLAPGVLEANETEGLRQALEEIYARQCEEVGGQDALARLNDADLVRCPLAYDDRFLELAAHPLILDVSRAILGVNTVLLMQNAILNRSDETHFQANWHRDLNYQHWVSTRPLALSVLVTLDTFSELTGATSFLPSSHRFEDFPSDRLAAQTEVTVEAPPGSIIFFDSMVFHRAGANRSGRVRRAVNHVIGAPILAQQVDIPAMLRRPAPADPGLAGYLGYRWNPVPSVADWRRRKLELLDAKGSRA